MEEIKVKIELDFLKIVAFISKKKNLITWQAFEGFPKTDEVNEFLAQMRTSPLNFPTQMELHR